jgi:hypothetical protein
MVMDFHANRLAARQIFRRKPWVNQLQISKKPEKNKLFNLEGGATRKGFTRPLLLF